MKRIYRNDSIETFPFKKVIRTEVKTQKAFIMNLICQSSPGIIYLVSLFVEKRQKVNTSM